MHFYSTFDYESEDGQTLERFAADIAKHRVESEFNEYTPEHLSLITDDGEIAVSDDVFKTFCKMCEEAHGAELEADQEAQDYHNETRNGSYR